MDSEAQDKTQTDKENPAGSTAITVVIKNPPDKNGVVTVREVQKDNKGRFLKKVKPLPPTVEFTRAERKALLQAGEQGLTEYMQTFMNIVRIAQYDGEDAKSKMAAVKAFEALRLSALGKPAPSEQELEKLETQPVRVIMVTAPAGVRPMEEKPKEKTKPSFIDAEVIQQNK